MPFTILKFLKSYRKEEEELLEIYWLIKTLNMVIENVQVLFLSSVHLNDFKGRITKHLLTMTHSLFPQPKNFQYKNT